jgi:hypothetical protein
VSFVRCINPTESQQQNVFDDLHVLDQLQTSGVLHCVRIRHEGFPFRALHTAFLNRFPASAIKVQRIVQSSARLLNDKEITIGILEEACGKATLDNKRSYLVGETRVFWQQSVDDALREFELRALQAVVQFIQARWRFCVRHRRKQRCSSSQQASGSAVDQSSVDLSLGVDLDESTEVIAEGGEGVPLLEAWGTTTDGAEMHTDSIPRCCMHVEIGVEIRIRAHPVDKSELPRGRFALVDFARTHFAFLLSTPKPSARGQRPASRQPSAELGGDSTLSLRASAEALLSSG